MFVSVKLAILRQGGEDRHSMKERLWSPRLWPAKGDKLERHVFLDPRLLRVTINSVDVFTFTYLPTCHHLQNSLCLDGCSLQGPTKLKRMSWTQVSFAIDGTSAPGERRCDPDGGQDEVSCTC